MNLFIGVGRLATDVTTRYSNNADRTCVANYTMAFDRTGRKEDGKQNADFVKCVALGKNGEFAEKYLKKGMKIAIEGQIQTGSYKDKDGKTVYTTEIMVTRHEFCESKGNAPAESSEVPSTSDDGFMNIPEGIAEELPFAQPTR